MPKTARLFVTGASTLALVAAAAVVNTPAAHAGTDERITVKGGTVTFTHEGDYIDAYDLEKDGYCLTAELKVSDFLPISSTTACGYNTYTYKSLSNINENVPVWLRACYTHKKSGGGYTRVKCSSWQGAHT
ncbi:hypothetical protein [Kribbella italica]|uniref:Secreted protein n=1 Tax=Kribbella italica TaxID=1540520 RepID=A0A7W9JEI8_9ACTN|nr:hypothetical protein [Kribbella italica]MBB5840653.1 hypothetical protein [Kribbella italica]